MREDLKPNEAGEAAEKDARRDQGRGGTGALGAQVFNDASEAVPEAFGNGTLPPESRTPNPESRPYGLTLTYFCSRFGWGSPPYMLPSRSTATNSAPSPAVLRGSPHG